MIIVSLIISFRLSGLDAHSEAYVRTPWGRQAINSAVLRGMPSSVEHAVIELSGDHVLKRFVHVACHVRCAEELGCTGDAIEQQL